MIISGLLSLIPAEASSEKDLNDADQVNIVEPQENESMSGGSKSRILELATHCTHLSL